MRRSSFSILPLSIAALLACACPADDDDAGFGHSDDDSGGDDDTGDDDTGDDDTGDDDTGDDDAGDDDTTAPECPADQLEPNDSQAAAATVPAGSYPGLDACPGDDDWYEIVVPGGQILEVHAVFGHAEGDIDLVLYDVTSAILASSTSQDDNEEVAWQAEAATALYARVLLAQDLGDVLGNEYIMEVDVAPPACTADGWEPNDFQILAPLMPAGSHPDLRACPGDDDWFEIEMLDGELLEADLGFDPAEGDVDAALIDILGNVAASATQVAGGEEVRFVAPADGSWWMRVTLASDAGAEPGCGYDIDLSIGMPTCEPDVWEPNDAQGDASAGGPGPFAALTLCPGDEDWWEFVLGLGSDLQIDAFFSDQEGDVDLYLYDSAGTELAQAASSDDDEALSWTAAAAGGHYLRVILAADSGLAPGNEYSMQVGIVSPPTCLPDVLEPNDSPSSPTWAVPGSWSGLSACPFDDDWFSLDLLAGQVLDVSATFSVSEGNVDIFLFDASGPLVQATATTDDEALTFPVVASGPHLLQVVLAADAGSVPGNSYDLVLAAPPLPTCPADPSEVDDTAALASPIPWQLGTDPWGPLTACGNPDWFSLVLPAAASVEIGILFDVAEGTVRGYLYDSTLGLLLGSTPSAGGQSLLTSAVAQTDLFLEVVLDSDAGTVPGNSYAIALDGTAGGACPTDSFEPDDTAATASPIWPGTFPSLAACQSGDDYFEIDLLASDSVQVDALFEQDEGDVDLFLLDPSSAVVASSTSNDDDESLAWTALVDGKHVLRATLVADAGAPGTTWDLVVSGPPACPVDDFEDDDSQEDALPVTPALRLLSACPSDDDWLVVWAGAGETVEAVALFDDAEGNVDVYLLDSSGTVIGGSASTDDDETFAEVVPAEGWYWVRTTLAADAGTAPGNPYEISLSVY